MMTARVAFSKPVQNAVKQGCKQSGGYQIKQCHPDPPSTYVGLYPLQGRSRVQNGDFPKRMQNQQVAVARHDEVGFRRQRARDDGVIVGIGGNRAGDERCGDGLRQRCIAAQDAVRRQPMRDERKGFI